nr:hypothetical protein [Tanacetum cinerariifolium]
MSFSKRLGNDVVCYTKPLDSLKGWNDHFFWVDTFACPVLFSWHTGKSVSKDAIPKSSEFNAEHYATLVAYPAPFHKYPEPFLCLIGMSQMDLLSFIRNADPTKVRIGEREHDEDEPKLLETIVGRVVPLLLVAIDHSSGELEASVYKLFDEGGSDVSPAELQRKKKQKTKVAGAGEPSHPAKKLRGDYGASGEPAVGGKSQSAVQRLLAEAVRHAEVRGGVMPYFPFVSSFVSTTPKREGEDPTDILAGANLQAEVDSVVRTFVPIMTSATTVTPTVDPAALAKKRLFGSSVFGGDSSFAGGSHPLSGGFSDHTGSDFLVGGIRTIVDPDSNLQRVYVPQWNVNNGFCMDGAGVCREMVDEAARQVSLSAKVRMRAEYNIKEKRRLKSVVEEKDSFLKSKCDEIESLKAQLVVNKAEAAEAVRLCNEAQALRERNAALEREKNELGVKVTHLAASVKVREQEVADLDVVVTAMKLQNDSLADQVHKLEVSAAGLQEQVTVYEKCMSQLEKF